MVQLVRSWKHVVSRVGPLGGLGRPARGRLLTLTLAMIRVVLLMKVVGPCLGLGRLFLVLGLRPGVRPIPTLIIVAVAISFS